MADTGSTGAEEEPLHRAIMAGIGAVAGLAVYLATEIGPETRGGLFLVFLVIGFFAVFFALTGPLNLRRAMIGASVLVLPAAGLMYWISLRFEDPEMIFITPWPVGAFMVLMLVGTPFVSAGLRVPGGARDYTELFDASWTMVVRYIAAWAFTGLFWLLVFLSDALLRLVALDVLEDALTEDGVWQAVTGAVLGLALAVVYELRAYVSPFLVLRLLRLLLVPVLAVVLVFVLALPIRGMSGLFGGLSVAATLMAVNVTLLTLVSASIDRDGAHAVQSPLMRGAVQIGAAITLVLAVLMLVAVMQRVAQYGWTPDRVAAATVSALFVVYGAGYAAAILRRGMWESWLRRVNRQAALATLALAALWLTPLLNAERWAARDQADRYLSGKTPLEDLPLFEMLHEWGHAGDRAVEVLLARTDHPDHAALVMRVEQARTASSRYALESRGTDRARAEMIAGIRDMAIVWPEGAAIPEDAFATWNDSRIRMWRDGCARRTPDGRAGCAFVFAPFHPQETAPQAMGFLLVDDQQAQAEHIVFDGGATSGHARVFNVKQRNFYRLPMSDYLGVLDGDFTIGPVNLNALSIGGFELFPAK